MNSYIVGGNENGDAYPDKQHADDAECDNDIDWGEERLPVLETLLIEGVILSFKEDAERIPLGLFVCCSLIRPKWEAESVTPFRVSLWLWLFHSKVRCSV